MISIKKYLDANEPSQATAEPEPDQLSSETMDCYRAAILAIGKVAVQISPGLGVDLETNLRGIERRLSVGYSPESLKRIASQVEVQLNEWGTRTSGHFKAQADEVKELLIALARTAESVGSRDQGYSSKFNDLTGRLARIADLNDLTQIRSSIVERVTELKSSVDQMTRDNQRLVAQLRAEVSTYESKLKSVETLASKDQLTNVANRRSIEERMHWNIENSQEFSVAMVDLNRFKQVNDTHGHLAGDDLLKQFAAELQLITRSGDLVGRWGGDEFLVILSGDLKAAKSYAERVQQWVFGKYTLRGTGNSSVVVQVNASIGNAEWHRGETMLQLIAEADADMYLDKKVSRERAS
jgi:diguanylate cyclase (GGDEF)-like protein